MQTIQNTCLLRKLSGCLQNYVIVDLTEKDMGDEARIIGKKMLNFEVHKSDQE